MFQLCSQFSSMWHAQEHYNSHTQPLINLVSAHILGRVRFCLKFYIILCIFFYKIKTKEHPNLHDTFFLVLFRVYVGENSRTFQDLIVEFKDFSRIYSKIQGLFKTVRTLNPMGNSGITHRFWEQSHLSTDAQK